MKKSIFLVLIIFGTSVSGRTVTDVPDPTELLTRNTEYKLQTQDSRPKTTDNRQQTTENKGQKTDDRIVNAESLIVNRKEPKSPAALLWEQRISSIPQDGYSDWKTVLEKSVNQLRSVEISRPAKEGFSPEPIIIKTFKTFEKTEPNKAALTLPDANAGDSTAELVRKLCEKPSAVEDSFNTAELLYIKGYLKEASIFYRETLNRQKAVSKQKAWVLYQVGNCLRNSDPNSSLASYRQLVSEFPDSPWTAAAKAQERILDWMQKEKVKELLK